MRKLIITEWVSLDGVFDAGNMDKWWMPFDSTSRQQYIQETINQCDIMLYGRKTYQMLFPYWSTFTHNEQGVADQLNKGKKYVVSSTLTAGPWENTTVIKGIEEVKRIKKEDGGYILVQGSGSLIKPLLEAGLVDELRLLVNPAIVGSGERPCGGNVDCTLQFSGCRPFDKGVILLTYLPGR
jgi:dihydrofolate reductase